MCYLRQNRRPSWDSHVGVIVDDVFVVNQQRLLARTQGGKPPQGRCTLIASCFSSSSSSSRASYAFCLRSHSTLTRPTSEKPFARRATPTQNRLQRLTQLMSYTYRRASSSLTIYIRSLTAS